MNRKTKVLIILINLIMFTFIISNVAEATLVEMFDKSISVEGKRCRRFRDIRWENCWNNSGSRDNYISCYDNNTWY